MAKLRKVTAKDARDLFNRRGVNKYYVVDFLLTEIEDVGDSDVAFKMLITYAKKHELSKATQLAIRVGIRKAVIKKVKSMTPLRKPYPPHDWFQRGGKEEYEVVYFTKVDDFYPELLTLGRVQFIPSDHQEGVWSADKITMQYDDLKEYNETQSCESYDDDKWNKLPYWRRLEDRMCYGRGVEFIGNEKTYRRGITLLKNS